MFDRLQKRFMTPLGKELLAALYTDDWEVRGGESEWVHRKSGISLFVGYSRVQLVDTPGLDLTGAERKAALNSFDQRMFIKHCKRALARSLSLKKNETANSVLNLLRLSQHKDN